MTEPLWRPSEDRKASTNMTRFMATVAPQIGRPIPDHEALHRFSVTDSARFWSLLWDFAGIVGDKGAEPYLADAEKMPGARFFPSARLNYAENALRLRGPEPAIVFWGEDKLRRRLTRDELADKVGRLQGYLAECGLTAGDRVGAVMPNCPESVVAMLAAASLGGVWSSCSPDFGVQGVLDRLAQVAPRVLVVCDGYYYAGKTIDITDKLVAIAAAMPDVERIVVVPYLGRDAEVVAALNKGAGTPRAIRWADAVETRGPREPLFVRLPFQHPLYILFSSGTTGVPKCIVHSAGGLILKHASEHLLHTDVKPGDRLFYFTTLGWMMWNWLMSGLQAGATLMLYDGSPFHPTGHILWDFAAAERCTHFGTSAKYIDALKKAGFEPARTHDLASLRAIMSTGSPLAQESFDYVYDDIKRDLHLASISGGTDLCGCFVLGNPLKAVYRGEIQGPAIGLDVDVADSDAHHMAHGKGELVCRNPFPSMPIGFWNDPDGARYRSAYFERFPGLWHHGDFAEWTEHGGMIIHGRSDATLNPGGVRIGTAEIYRQVEQLPEVQESVVIGQDFEGDVRVVLFVVLKPGFALDEALIGRIKRQIKDGASPRHVPAKVIQVADIPRTKSGKITELAVRDVIMGRAIKNKEALANPEALDLYRDLDALRG